MTKRTNLSSVPDDAGVPEDTEIPQRYTLGDQLSDNAILIAAVSEASNLDPAVVTNLFQITLNFHLAKINMGITQPTEVPE